MRYQEAVSTGHVDHHALTQILAGHTLQEERREEGERGEREEERKEEREEGRDRDKNSIKSY